jgi:ADP-ribosylglycohydrolase
MRVCLPFQQSVTTSKTTLRELLDCLLKTLVIHFTPREAANDTRRETSIVNLPTSHFEDFAVAFPVSGEIVLEPNWSGLGCSAALVRTIACTPHERRGCGCSYFGLAAQPNFEEAVVLAVNHSGDSDGTGAIAGNICGSLYGVEAIPARWADFVELHDEIIAMADDLAALAEGNLEEITDPIWDRYPGW